MCFAQKKEILLVIKTKVVYLHCQTTTTGRLPRTIKRKSKWQQQFTTVYYTQQKKLIAISALKSTVFRKKKQVKRDFQIGVAVRKTQWL